MKLKLAFLAAVLTLLIGGIVFVQTAPSVLAQGVPGKLLGPTSAPFTCSDANAILQAGSLTTTGSSGPASFSGCVLNIPQYSGGGGLTAPTLFGAFTSAATGSAQVMYSASIAANAWNSSGKIATLDIPYSTGSAGVGTNFSVVFATSAGATTGTAIMTMVGLPKSSTKYTLHCEAQSTGANAQTAWCYTITSPFNNASTNGTNSDWATATITSSSTIFINVVLTTNGNSGDVVSPGGNFKPFNW